MFCICCSVPSHPLPAPCPPGGGAVFVSVGLSGKRCSLPVQEVRSSPTEAFPGQGGHVPEQDGGRNGAFPSLAPFLGRAGPVQRPKVDGRAGPPELSTCNLFELLVSLQRPLTLSPLTVLISHAANSWQHLLRWFKEETINRGDKPVKAGPVPLLGQGAAKALPRAARRGGAAVGVGVCPALLWHFPLLVLLGSDNRACSCQSLSGRVILWPWLENTSASLPAPSLAPVDSWG